jgi:hypothetical protein
VNWHKNLLDIGLSQSCSDQLGNLFVILQGRRMQNFTRASVPPPTCLSDERAGPGRKALWQMFHTEDRLVAHTRVSMSEYAVDDPELDEATHRLFHGRCAFCENSAPTRPYRFRPMEEAGPISAAPADDAPRAHLYYTWLTNAWQNIYSICDECRPSESSIFPVRGHRCDLPTYEEVEAYCRVPTGAWPGSIPERPLFLDPCSGESYQRNLAATPTGKLVPLTQRGSATIQQFRLERTELEMMRERNFARRLSHLVELRGTDSGTFDFDVEFGGTWYLLLYQLARKMGTGGSVRMRLTSSLIGSYFRERLSKPRALDQLHAAIDDLARNPEQLRPSLKRGWTLMTGTARPVSFVISNFKAIEHLHIDLVTAKDRQKLKISMRQDPEGISSQSGRSGTPAVVILGENAAGKSASLEALALVLSGQEEIDDLDLDTSAMMLDPAQLGGSALPLRSSHIRVRYEDDSEASVMVRLNRVSYEKEVPADRIPVFAYGAFRMFMGYDKRRRPSSSVRSLFEPDYVLPNPEKWLASLYGGPKFDEVVRALRSILALNQEFDVIDVDPDTGRCYLVITQVAAAGEAFHNRTPLSVVSSGFRSVLGMACDILRGLLAGQTSVSASLAKVRAVVLIDEIEAHLHPRWKMRIIRGLREALPEVTFMFTTHDPLCLRGLGASELIVLRRMCRDKRGGREELPFYVERFDELPAVDTLTIEQVLTSDFFQLFTTDAPVTEVTLAQVGDLLAISNAGHDLNADDRSRLEAVREDLRAQIRRSLPLGSTEVESLVQDAVEEYLRARTRISASDLPPLRAQTRDSIVKMLGRY